MEWIQQCLMIYVLLSIHVYVGVPPESGAFARQAIEKSLGKPMEEMFRYVYVLLHNDACHVCV